MFEMPNYLCACTSSGILYGASAFSINIPATCLDGFSARANIYINCQYCRFIAPDVIKRERIRELKAHTFQLKRASCKFSLAINAKINTSQPIKRHRMEI